MEDGLKDNADTSATYGSTEKAEEDPKAAASPAEAEDNANPDEPAKEVVYKVDKAKVTLITFGLLSILLVFLNAGVFITMAVLFGHFAQHRVLPYYFFAGLLFFITGVLSITVTIKKELSYLITLVVFSVISIIVCLPPIIIIIMDFQIGSSENLEDILLFVLFVSTCVELVMAFVICILASRQIHNSRQ